MAMRLSDEQLDWFCDRIPDAPRRPLGGWAPTDKRKAVAGIFWILDNGAKWKDLPCEFGSKSAVHRCFKRWVEGGVFERIMRDAGRLIEDRGDYRLYECYIDAMFSKAKGGGDGIGCTKGGKGVKIMVLVDARGLPVAVDTAPASPHESAPSLGACARAPAGVAARAASPTHTHSTRHIGVSFPPCWGSRLAGCIAR